MDMQQGADRADAILQQTLSGITPALRWNHGPSIDRICADGKGEGTGTGTVTRRIVILTKVSAERRGNLLGVIERDWKSRGFKIINVNSDKDMPAMDAATPDRFQVSVEVGATGQFGFTIGTPCLAKTNGVTNPTTTPNTPQRDVPFPPRDDIHDDFWSAVTPGGSSPQRPSSTGGG
ncbi:hypothetical protein [Streptomyces crystallinus]